MNKFRSILTIGALISFVTNNKVMTMQPYQESLLRKQVEQQQIAQQHAEQNLLQQLKQLKQSLERIQQQRDLEQIHQLSPN